MIRYDFHTNAKDSGKLDMRVSAHEGDWVRYEEAAREIAALRLELELCDTAWREDRQKVRDLQRIPTEARDNMAVIPLSLVREWRETMLRYTASDHDGESYNNNDAIEAEQQMAAYLSAPVSPPRRKQEGIE